MEALLDHLPVFAYRTRPAGAGWALEYINGGVEAITGYPVADFLECREQASVTLILAEDQAWLWPAPQRLLEARRPYAFEDRVRTASGEIRWLLDKGRGLYAADGTLAWLVRVATGITVRKQAEEALRASREEWRARFEATADPAFLADADTGVILDANRTVETLFGYSPQGLLAMRLYPL